MSLLVIGCGYLGLTAARLARQSGQDVWGTVRSAESARRLTQASILPVLLDVLDPASPALPPAHHILYCVGYDRAAGSSMRAVYVEGLKRTLDRLPPESRLVYASSTGVYGQTDGSWVDEQSPTEPSTPSGVVCLEAEEIVRSLRPSAVILRFAGLYGPGRLPRRAQIERAEPVPADPDHWLNLIHISDAARLALACLDQQPPASLYNIAGGDPVKRRLFYESMAALLGCPPPRFEPAAASGRDRSNKRVSARAIQRDLGLPCLHPTIESGLLHALREPES